MFTSLVFLHHSVGSNLISQGNVRQLMHERGYALFDHGYNEEGLALPDGRRAAYSYRVPSDNTDPHGLATIFAQDIDPESTVGSSPPSNTLSGLLRHDVIIFKSCFPASGISSEAELDLYKRYYQDIRSTADRHPDHIFIALSTPPLEPGSTNPEEASRARAFARWLTSPDYLAGHPNLFAFDLFDLLAEPDPGKPDHNMLRANYRPTGSGPKSVAKRVLRPILKVVRGRDSQADSHPTPAANQIVGPLLVDAVDAAITSYAAQLTQAAAASGGVESPVWGESRHDG